MRRCVEATGIVPASGLLRAQLRRHAAALATALIASVGAMFSGGAAAEGVPQLDEAEALRLAQAAIGQPIPDVALRNREGRAVRLSSYHQGKPLVVSFIYTGCFEVCPTQTRALLEAVRGLEQRFGESQFNVVSIGFNQPFDGPDELRAFAAQHRIKHANWDFLAPARESVAPLTRGFGFSYVQTPAGFDHVLGVTVVGADGRIVAQVLGDKMRADKLGEPLGRLLLAMPASADTLSAVIERVRILCTVYDPDTGTYRYDWKLILELIGGAMFFFTVLGYLGLEWRRQRRMRRTAPALAAGGAGAPCLPAP